MRGWPPIEDTRVLRWLALSDAEWREIVQQRWREVSAGAVFDDAALERALGYPWARPASSYVLRDGAVEVLEELEPARRRALVGEFSAERHPLVAFGANGAPSRLEARFAGFEHPADRSALVLTGWLHEVDVGAQASPTFYGSMPGALVASPGTAVRAAVLWLTTRQLAEITLAELGYRLGRLDRAHFTMDEADVEVEDLFAYVSRIGGLRVEGEPVALAAIPARDRRLREMTQAQLLEVIGEIATGARMPAAEVVRMCHEDIVGLADRVIGTTWPEAVRLPDDHWTPYPVDG